MLAKRVVRLALGPGALPSVLLVAVVGLIWVSTGRLPLLELLPDEAASVAQGPASAITYRGAAGPDAPPVNLEQAVGSARRFAGESGLALEGALQSDSMGGRASDVYYLETAGAVRGEDFFKVDAHTGEVIEATLRSRLAPSVPPLDLTASDAEQVAGRFAHQRFFGFEDLTLVERSNRGSDGNTVHSFKWTKVSPETGAELPVSVSVAVASGSGEVVWYLAQRDPLQIDVRPSVDRPEALRMAVGALGERGTRWDTETPLSVRLQVLYDEQNHQQLVWSITLRSRQLGTRPTIRLLVNAHTGRPMAGPS